MANVSFASNIDFKQIFTTIVIILVTFFAGFWTGKRIYENKNKNTLNFTQTSSSSQNVIAKEVDGVFWIKAGEEAMCPETHPIKGKFSEGVGFFYTSENKSYARVKPEFCLVSEEYAKNSGFLKK